MLERLPVDIISGLPYYRDDRRREFRPVYRPWIRISFSQMEQLYNQHRI